MLTIYIPLLVAILGVLVYALSSNAKVVELGRIAYAFGLLVTLVQCAGRALHL
jgi:SpoU rRNA methylase family enzyme